jgi:hypothetical protein
VERPWTSAGLKSVELSHLLVNVGHQRGIAIGMDLAVEQNDANAVLVMDGDGEDSPGAITNLLVRVRVRVRVGLGLGWGWVGDAGRLRWRDCISKGSRRR